MKMDRKKLNILCCSLAGVIITWFINHQMGYGAIVANGLVGVIATMILPAPLAGVAYTASFVGMSSTVIIPSLTGAALGGLIVGIILLVTTEIYAGIGGKGGTTAALASIITKTIVNFFV